MPFVEFNVVGRDRSENGPRLLQALMLMRQADENFVVPWLCNQSPLPAWFTEIVQKFRRLLFFYFFRVPGADEENQIVSHTIGSSQISRILGCFRLSFLENQPLFPNLVDICE